jgi:hypothetical protein
MAPSQTTPIWSSQVAYSSLTLLANASMFGREQYFPKAIRTSAPHFGNEMAAPLQSSRQPTYSDFLAYINASTAMYHDLTTSQAPLTTWLMLYPVIFIYGGLI